MSDYGDFCREMREHKQEVKRRMWKENQRFADELVALGGSFIPLPGGLRFLFDTFRVDFWPSSGKWTIVGTNTFTNGPRKMVSEVKRRLEESSTNVNPNASSASEPVRRDSPDISVIPTIDYDDTSIPWDE